MLQQTQTHRVEPKYLNFIKKFPTFRTLAKASTPEVLSAWQGLGYNRRALYLKKIAETVTRDYRGKLPSNPAYLGTLPGIGPNTAGSISAFAFNQPIVFIETNIRRVFIHFFFADKEGIHDRDIIPLVEETLDQKNSREWYFALMDYGVMLAKNIPNPNRRSRHYAVQSKFSGSDRQARGLILKILLAGPAGLAEFKKQSGRDALTLQKILAGLTKEGFIVKRGSAWRLIG
jgi:A/G-specific adenine glycosylase